MDISPKVKVNYIPLTLLMIMNVLNKNEIQNVHSGPVCRYRTEVLNPKIRTDLKRDHIENFVCQSITWGEIDDLVWTSGKPPAALQMRLTTNNRSSHVLNMNLIQYRNI